MKIEIRYFSGTGNTKYIAELFSRNLKGPNREVNTSSIIESDSPLSDMDLLIVGGPIYAGNIPQKLIRWISRNIPETSKPAKAIVFTTSAGSENAKGIYSMRKKLEKKNYTVISAQAFVMARNYYFKKYKPTAEEEIAKLGAIAEKSVIQISEKVLHDDISPLKESGQPVTGLDLTARLFSSIARIMGRNFQAGDSCIKCMKCLRECPAGNISLKKEKISFAMNCMLCTKCIHNCPTHSISYKEQKYLQYKGPEFYKEKTYAKSN